LLDWKKNLFFFIIIKKKLEKQKKINIHNIYINKKKFKMND
jgi:hypothetical protein